jgi:hypothetical protein
LEKECKKDLEIIQHEKQEMEKATKLKMQRSQSENGSLLLNENISLGFQTANKSQKNSIDIKTINHNNNNLLNSRQNINFQSNFKGDYNFFKLNFPEEKLTKEKMDNENFEYKYKNVEKNLTVMSLVKGAFAGLEVLFEKEANNYNYSFKATGPLNFLFKINLDNFPEIKKDILEFLNPIYKKQKLILKTLLKKKLSVKIYMENVFEKSQKNNQQMMLGKIAKDLKSNVIQKEKQKNELKNIVHKFSKKYIHPQNLIVETSSQENNYYNNYDEVCNNNNKHYENDCNDNYNYCEYLTENANESQIIRENRNSTINEFNNNKKIKINKCNSFSNYNTNNYFKENSQNNNYKTNDCSKSNAYEPISTTNYFKNFSDTAINSKNAKGERRFSFNSYSSLRQSPKNGLFQSLNNIKITNNTSNNLSENKNQNNNIVLISRKQSNFNDKKIAISNSNISNSNKNTEINFFSPIVFRDKKTSDTGSIFVRKINNSLNHDENKNLNNKINKNLFGSLISTGNKNNNRNSLFENKVSSPFKRSIFINSLDKNLSENFKEKTNIAKIKIKLVEKSDMIENYFLTSTSKNDINHKDPDRRGSSVFIEFNLKPEKPNNREMKFSMVDAFEQQKQKETKSESVINLKNIKVRDVGVRTPIRNCINNWRKMNFEVDEVDEDKKIKINSNSKNYKNSNFITKNKNDGKLEAIENESLSYSPIKKNKNLNFFRTSFFNLPLISSLSWKK